MPVTSRTGRNTSMPVKVAASLAMTALLSAGLVAGVSDEAYAAACGNGTAPSSGDGSVGDPWQIASKDNLLWVSWVTSADQGGSNPTQAEALADSYLQTATTIDLEDCEWSPIGDRTNKFVGSFDGGGFTVSGLLVAQNEEDAGLFGVTNGATLKNLTLVAADVTATRTASTSDADDAVFYAGALVGDAQGSTVIEDMVVNGGTVDAPIAGGLAGKSAGSVTDSESSATVSSGSSADYNADFAAGGLVGANAGTVTGSDASGAVTSYDEAAGGFVGRNLTGAGITDSTASGVVATEDGDNAGGFAGENAGTITGSSATGAVTSGDDRAGGFVGDNDGTIENCSASGTAESAGGSSSDDAGGFAGRNSAGAVIRNSTATGDADADDNAGGFVGENEGEIFDSSASGSATAATDKAGGFVGWMEGAASKVARSSATGSAEATGFNAGGFVGRNEGTVENSSATGSAQAGEDVGGFAGRNSTSGAVEGSQASGSATAVDDNAGGFIGSNWGDVDASWSSGNAEAGGDNAGGFVGAVRFFNTDTGSVSASFATGTASAGGDHAGGFAGRLGAGTTISNSFATGSSTATGSEAGGFVGQNEGTVSASYAVGTATATVGTVGGFAGVNNDTINNAFWNTETSGLSSSDGGTGKTTAEMKSIATYNDTATVGLATAWAIVPASAFGVPDGTSTEIWGIGSGVNCGYPFLYWQDESGHSCPVAEASTSSPRERQASAPAIHLDLQADVGDGAVGAPVVIGGQGLAPGSTMTLVVRSTPQTLETGRVSSLGNFSSEVSLPALPAGTHTLTLTGIGPGGSTLSLVQSFTVAPNGVITALDSTSGTQVGGLAATGPGDLRSWGLAVVALLFGGLLLSGAAVRRNARLTL